MAPNDRFMKANGRALELQATIIEPKKDWLRSSAVSELLSRGCLRFGLLN